MFYQENMDHALRFGDVLRGFVLSGSNITSPVLAESDINSRYQIDVSLPQYCVVLSPCCSIGDKVISLTPLIRIEKSFFQNPYFAEDVTRINRQMEPQQTTSAEVWENLPEPEKMRRLASGKGYAFLHYFIYDRHPILPMYTFGALDVFHYMVDFRRIFSVSSNSIASAKQAPLESKCLQLSVEARSDLRIKIAYYYGRIPEEDKVELE